MIRVLHLLDRDADWQAQRMAADLSRGLGNEFAAEIRRMGQGGFRDLLSAMSALRQCEQDIIHCWGIGALAAAAFAGRRRLVYSPMSESGSRGIRWLRAIGEHRNVEVVCSTSTQRRTHAQRGIPFERCHLIRPGVDFARIRRRRNDELRRSLGLTPDDHVILAAGESTRAANHYDAVWAVSMLHVVDEKYRILLWGRGAMAAACYQLGQKLRQPRLVILAEQCLGPVEFEQLLPAVDGVLATARGPIATLPIAITMAAALPIVATVTPTVSELLEDRHTALMVRSGSARDIARRIQDLQENPSIQWSIADMARTEAYEYFSHTRFIEQHRALYRQIVAGEKVQVIEPAPGAGLRFHRIV